MPLLPLDAQDPRELGRFRLLGRLGEGGQGIVYLGDDRKGLKVAVKVLKAGTTPAVRAAMQKEMAAAQQVARFCTARVIEASVDGPQPFVVSEYVDGPSLEDRVARQGALAEGDLDRLVVNTASALRAIHAAGVVHRDLKPANVLLGPDGPRVVDFGIARQKDAQTLTGKLVGTPAYMAPEQFQGEPASPASDVFAWAGTMAFAATGRAPFGEGSNIAAVMRAVVNGEPDLDGVPANLLPLFRTCLAKEPDRRPSARDLLDLLLDPGAGLAEEDVRTVRAARRLEPIRDLTEPVREPLGQVGPDGEPEDLPALKVREKVAGNTPAEPSIPPGSSLPPAPYSVALTPPPSASAPPPGPAPVISGPSSIPPGVTAADAGMTTPPGAGRPAPAYVPGAPPPPGPPPGQGRPWQSPAKPAGRRRAGRAIAAGAALVVVAGGVAGGWFLLRGGSAAGSGSPTVPARYAATWAGTVSTGTGTTTQQISAAVSLYAGKSQGSAEFRDSGCLGTLTLTSATQTGLIFQLADSTSSCPSGQVTVYLTGATLNYHLQGEGGLVQNGTLAKTG